MRFEGRRVTSTRNWAGITSSRSERSSSMECRAPPQPVQSRLSGSTTTSTRGRCGGSAPRLARRRAARSAFSAGVPASASARSSAISCCASSSASSSWSASSFSERRPNIARWKAATAFGPGAFRRATSSARSAFSAFHGRQPRLQRRRIVRQIEVGEGRRVARHGRRQAHPAADVAPRRAA